MRDLDRLIKLINARSEDEIFAGRQCGGDGRSAVGRLAMKKLSIGIDIPA